MIQESAIDQCFLDGTALYGDDFSDEEIARWYEDEREAYANLGSADRSTYSYEYHALNALHGFRHLRGVDGGRLLGFGSAYGDEIEPLAGRFGQIDIIEPSSAFARTHIAGVPVRYLTPDPSGRIDMADGTVDVVTCLGVLHHIPNVTRVLAELVRVTKPGGWLLIREPIISMGDWSRPRPGLTSHERGIPQPILRRIVAELGLTIVSERVCLFGPLTNVLRRFMRMPFNKRWVVRLDSVLSRATGRNVSYHATSFRQRLRPASVFLVARKGD